MSSFCDHGDLGNRCFFQCLSINMVFSTQISLIHYLVIILSDNREIQHPSKTNTLFFDLTFRESIHKPKKT